MSTPKISIITVCKNSEKTLERTILSVLNQTYTNYEYIIIDGRSTDKTVDIIKKYESQFASPVIWKSESDTGIYDAMNKGIALTSGELIGIINSDDWYEKNTLERVQEEYPKGPLSVMYGSLRVMKNGIEKKILTVHHNSVPNVMIPHPTCFVPKEIYSRFGLFNSNFRYAADLELMLRFIFKGVQFKFIDSVLANYEEGGVTDKYFHKSTKEVFQILHQYGYISKFSMYLHQLNETRRELFK